MKPHFLTDSEGKREWAIIPYDEYLATAKKLRLLQRAQSSDGSNDPPTPLEVTQAIAKGDHPIRAWREYRGMTQSRLAEEVGFSKPYICQIETGIRSGQTSVLSSIADALSVTLDDLLIEEEG